MTNPNKYGKIYLVFDSIAKASSVTLNVSLLTGPDLYNSFIGVLFKCRQTKIAFTAVTRSMF